MASLALELVDLPPASARDAIARLASCDARDALEYLVGAVARGDQRLCAALDGPLVDLLSDAVALAPEDRRKKWQEEEAARARAGAEHRATQDALEHARRGARGARARMRHESMRFPRDPLASEGVVAVVSRPSAWVAARPPTFWNAISFDNCSDHERHALAHAVLRVTDEAGRSAVPDALRSRCEGLLAAPPPPEPAPPPPPPRASWIRRVLRRFR